MQIFFVYVVCGCFCRIVPC